MRGWRAAFPPAAVAAGVSAAMVAEGRRRRHHARRYGIPVSLAYASLAGLPPQYGIYCYLLGGLFYALFGSSRQLAIGPTSASRCLSVPRSRAWPKATPALGGIAALDGARRGRHVRAGVAAAI